MQKLNKPSSKQKGIALIIFALILIVVTTVFFVSQLDGNEIKIERDKKTAAAMAEAKNALLGWSVSQAMPGQLPCPEDTTLIGSASEGTALTNCNSALPVVGRLPWRTLGLGNLRDGNTDKLWYALSTGFSDVAVPINSTTNGQINVNGTINVIAIIFSPGVILAGQNRPMPTNVLPPQVADYLDLTNNDGDINFSSTGTVGAFNDKLLLVTKADLFNLVARRILQEVRGDTTQGLVNFYSVNSNQYAFADTDNNGTSDGSNVGTPSYQGTNNSDSNDIFFIPPTLNILVNNNWMPLINYQISASRQTVTMTLNGQTLTVP